MHLGRSFNYKIRFLYTVILCVLFFQCVEEGFAKVDLDGSVRVRGVLSQAGSEFLFLPQGRIYIKGEFRPSNRFTSKIHLLSSTSYLSQIEQSFGIYPSINWFINEDLELKFGRIRYQNHFHQIVSLNDYESLFHTFDGFFLEYSTRVFHVNLWGSLYSPALLEYSTSSFNINFWGSRFPRRKIKTEPAQDLKYGLGFFLDIKSDSDDFIDHLNLHVVYLGEAGDKAMQNTSRYGIGLEGTINPVNLDYTLVAIGHGREMRFKLEEHMYHLQLSYSYPAFFNSHFFAGYHTDSAKYDPWLYDSHKNAGLLDLFSWGNLSYYFLGLGASINSLFDVQVSFHDLSFSKEGSVSLGFWGTRLEGKNEISITGDRKNLGKELDIQFQKKIKKNFEIHLLAGLFIPSLVFKKFFKNKSVYKNIQLTGYYKF